MKLNLQKVQQWDSKQIYHFLLPAIHELYLSFQYISISHEDYTKLVLKEISDSKKEYKGEQDYIEYIKDKIKVELSQRTKKMLDDPESSYTLLNNYMTGLYDFQKMNLSSYQDAIEYFKQLSSFLGTYHYVPNPDLWMELVRGNVIFQKVVSTIFHQYHKRVISGKIEEQLDDSLLLLTIDAYCMLNSVEIEKPENSYEEEDTSEFSVTNAVTTYLRDIDKGPLLSMEQERNLALRIAEGDSEARELFIERNLKLVVSIARNYMGRGLSFLDLIQEGNLGLMLAVDKYDVNKGYKFSTYATYWIRQSITRAISNKGRNIRIPFGLQEKIGLYRKTISKMEDKPGRSPTIEEIAKEMGLSIPEVTKLHKLQVDTVSMNTLVGEDKDTELEQFISSSQKTPEDIVIESTLPSQIRSLLETCNLKPREKEILMLRYGFHNGDPMGFREISKKYHLTVERIRQIEAKALMKIRRSEHIRELAAYTTNPEQSWKNIEKYREQYRDKKNQYKTFLSEYGRTEERNREEEMPRVLQTIYEYFKNYTREQVDEMLRELTEEERALVTVRYGTDLSKTASTRLTKEQNNKFYGTLIPKMKRLLENPTKKKSQRQRNEEGEKTFLEPSRDMKEIKLNETPKSDDGTLQEPLLVEEVPARVTPTIIPENPTQQESTEEFITKPIEVLEQGKPATSNRGEMTKEDCIKILELLRTPSFGQMMNTLSVKDAVIISLKLGYIDGKYFSTESISEFLGIEPKEVIETTKKVLLVYKENINTFLDHAIAIATDDADKEKVLSRTNPSTSK